MGSTPKQHESYRKIRKIKSFTNAHISRTLELLARFSFRIFEVRSEDSVPSS